MSEHAAEHHHPNYVKIWLVLVVLLVISVIGPMAEIQWLTLITAFGIALVKAFLVAKNFMHVSIEPKFVIYAVVTALAFMALLFFFVAPDVMKHDGQRWVNLGAAGEFDPPAVYAEDEEWKDTRGPVIPKSQQVAGADSAEAIFKSVCALCHGENGDGTGAAAAALNPKPANFNLPEFWESRDRDHLIKVITEGGVSVGKSALMAAYGGAYTPEQIAELADYIMGMKPN